jgi:hypothetical protein
MKRRIALKINTNSHSSSNTPGAISGQATIESPAKKIFLGEFDETNLDDIDNSNDDLLVSPEGRK